MGSKKVTKKLLKKMGLSHLEKELLNVPIGDRIADGKNKHRQHLQNVKNELLKQERERGTDTSETNPFFNFRQDLPDYGSFKNLLAKRNWDDIGLD